MVSTAMSPAINASNAMPAAMKRAVRPGSRSLLTGAEGRGIRKIRRTNAGRRHLGIDLGCSRQRLGRGLWHVALEARIDCAKPNPIARMQGDFTGPDSVNSCPVSRTKIAELVNVLSARRNSACLLETEGSSM